MQRIVCQIINELSTELLYERLSENPPPSIGVCKYYKASLGLIKKR